MRSSSRINFSVGKIIVTLIMLCIVIVGGTFAWFSYRSKESALVLSIGDINDSKIIINPYEIRDSLMPVNIYTSGVYSQVEVINNSSKGMEIKLFYRINNLDEEIIDSGLKYTIVNSDTIDGVYEEVKTGDFLSIEDMNEYVIYEDIVSSNTTLYYKVYVWLDSSVGNQSAIRKMALDVELNANGNVFSETLEYFVTFDANGGENIEEYVVTDFIYTTPGEYTFIAPVDGEYQLEVWGAQGGYAYTTNYSGGYGGYSKGKVYLDSGTNLYINVGGMGNSQTSKSGVSVEGGYNGGGNGGGYTDKYVGSGGGATHIATISGELNTLSSNVDDILIVAGGGGGAGYQGSSYYGIGGGGGGFKGNNGVVVYASGGPGIGIGGTQTAAGSGYVTGKFGEGGNVSSNGPGGGGGFYGGGGGKYYGGGGGGSGYIGNALLTNKLMYCYNCTTSSDSSTLTYSTQNISSSPISNYAKEGDGAGKIILFNSMKFNYGEKYGDLPTPTRIGYIFTGWYTEIDGGKKITSDTIMKFTENCTLYAHWVKGYTINFDPTGGQLESNMHIYTELGEHIFTTSLKGEYQFEVWGAQGGYAYTTDYLGGYGGYSKGIVYLDSGTNLYINVGGMGNSQTSINSVSVEGGYNGGGNGGGYTDKYVGGGGGATHIATISGELYTLSSNVDDVLIVAGGGGGAGYQSSSYYGNGGAGGGYNGRNGSLVQPGSASSVGIGGTQTAAGTGYATGKFGEGGNVASNGPGGGGGFYGGGGGKYAGGGGGGSGYIGNSLLTNKIMYCYNCATSSDNSTLTYSTQNISSTPVSNYVKIGDGAARIWEPVAKNLYVGAIYGDLPIPTRTGYTFLGWFTEEIDGTQVTADTVMLVESDHTLYAHWS